MFKNVFIIIVISGILWSLPKDSLSPLNFGKLQFLFNFNQSFVDGEENELNQDQLLLKKESSYEQLSTVEKTKVHLQAAEIEIASLEINELKKKLSEIEKEVSQKSFPDIVIKNHLSASDHKELVKLLVLKEKLAQEIFRTESELIKRSL